MGDNVIISGLVEIIKAGGPLALWGIFIWLGLGIVRLSIVCLVLFLVVRLVCTTISTNYRMSKETSTYRIHLLSAEVSKRVEDSLNTFTKDSLVVVNELKEQLSELKKKLDERLK